jgi:hypothetical protein
MFVEATKHNYNSGTEDRITQVVVACFNKSKIAQRIIISYFLGKYVKGPYHAISQEQSGISSRPDIIIYRNNFPYIVVESKTASSDDNNQLHLHKSNVYAKKYIIITQSWRDNHVPKGWIRKSWIELAQVFESEINRGDFNSSKLFDEQLCVELFNYFNEVGIMKPSRISREDFDKSVKFLDAIRFKEQPYLSINGIDSLKNIADAFEQVLEKLRNNNGFLKLIGLDRKFQSDVKLSYWWEIDLKDKSKETASRIRKLLDKKDNSVIASIKRQAVSVAIEKIIKLKKKNRNGITGLVLSLRQNSYRGTGAYIGIEIWNKIDARYVTCDSWKKQDISKRTGITVEELEKIALKKWQSFLRRKKVNWL